MLVVSQGHPYNQLSYLNRNCMEITRGHQIIAGALLAGGAIIGASLAHGVDADQRPSYTDGMVCDTPLEAGESPHSLAEDSAFAASTDDVIQRSQFINPSALLQHEADDDKHFTGSFNVFLRNTRDDTPSNRPSFDRTGDTCSINNADPELVSTFPTIEAAKKILESTVALRESEPSDDEYGFWRCGGIAVSGSTLLLPSSEYVSPENSCAGLAAGEVGDEPLRIISEIDSQQFRFVEVAGAELQPIKIAEDYLPAPDDILVYSGYSRGGGRQYFRVRVEGSGEGRVLVRAGVDQIDPTIYPYENEPSLEKMRGGDGGLFTLDGELVAVVESTNRFMNTDNIGSLSETYQQKIYDHNRQVEDLIKEYSGDNEITNYLQRQNQQYILGLTVPSGLVTELQATGD